MASSSNLSIEIRIQDLNFLLPLHEDSTIATITDLAFTEYTKICRQNAPKKILFVKDALNRILTPDLSILHHNIDRKLELVVDDYSKYESLDSSELEQVYRGWQLWSMAQVSDTLHLFLSKDTPERPDPKHMELLKEISKSNNEQVQLESIKIFKLLLTRFPQKETILASAECISATFSSTTFVAVAVACIEAFKDMSPLQYRLFDGARLIRDMHSVLLTLTRFPPESQAILLDAFRSIAAILEDPDLLSRHADLSTISSSSDKRADKKGANLVRLGSLLQSDDRTVRLFALQKTVKLLNPPHVHAPQIEKEDIGGTESNSAVEADKVPALYLALPEASNYTTKELQMLSLSLFSCIKKSICARNKTKLKEESAVLTDAVSKVKTSDQPRTRSDLGSSTAGRLIASALQSPLSDFHAVRLGLSCILLIAKCAVSEGGDDDDQYEMKSIMDCIHSQHNIVSGDLLIPGEVVLRDCAEESVARLLLTLTHADEDVVLLNGGGDTTGINRQHLKDIAENSAALFGIIASGWKSDPALKLELYAACRCLDSTSSLCKRMLALSYLTSMLPDTNTQLLQELLLRNGCRLLNCLWMIASADYQPSRLYRRAQLSAMQLIAELSACAQVGLFLREHGAAQRLLNLLKFCGRWRGDAAARMKIIENLRKKSEGGEGVARGIMSGANEFEDSSDSDTEKEGEIGVTERTDSSYSNNTSRSKWAELNRGKNPQDELKRRIKADSVLIRLILKTIANTELSLSSGRSIEEERTFRIEISYALQQLSLLPTITRGGNRRNKEVSNLDEFSGWKLSELAASDRVINFYFNLLTSS